MSFHYIGSFHNTIRQCARAYASTALPDLSVVEADADARTVALDLEAFWYEEGKRIGECEIPTHGDDPAVDEDTWRTLCREALEARIIESRAVPS